MERPHKFSQSLYVKRRMDQPLSMIYKTVNHGS